VNTIYFAARWKYPFDPNVTRDAAFTLLDGTTKQVPTMTGCYVLSAAAAVGGVDVLELSYAAGDLAMVLLVPPQGGLATFEQTLDAQTLAGLLAGSQYSPSCLSMPRFEVSTHASLRSALSTLGLGVAFSPDADFSGMTGAKGLAMDGVEHEAKVKVDESGTVAAAATYIPMAGGSPPAHIDVNRAFVFLVRDRATGLVLFAGHVVDP
jgi:serpin B